MLGTSSEVLPTLKGVKVLYAKIFEQIYDSSIAENPRVRFVFMDLLVLANSDGVVDITHEAIARRTNVPLDWVKEAIAVLEGPDPKSRTPDENGARIVRLDGHRDWGWIITNYHVFRDIATEDARRQKTKERVRRHREKRSASGNAPVTLCNAVENSVVDSERLTSCNARVTPPYASPSPSSSALPEGGLGETIPTLEDVRLYADISAVTADTALRFFNHHQNESLWLNRFGRLIDWRHKLVNWQLEDRANPRVNGSRSGIWHLKTQLEAVNKQITDHKANRDSNYYSGSPTDLDRASLRSLRSKAAELNGKIANFQP